MTTNGQNGEKHAPPFKLKDPTLLHQSLLIAGTWHASLSSERFRILDPGTSRPFASCPVATAADVPPAVAAAHAAFLTYRRLVPRARAKLLLAWNDLITAHKDDLATLVTFETGKPLAEAHAELVYALGFTWWFAGEAERVHGTMAQAAAPGRRIFTVKQPVGVAVALVPWNFPVAMILRKCAAALAAGCTMVIKPSPETPLSVLALAELALRAGFAPGVLNVLTTDLKRTAEVSAALCRAEQVRKVTFTGSTSVGKLVAGLCAEGLKKVTLELGGNCPFVVFEDADLEQAVEALMVLKWRHAGQACISANRVYVQKGVFARFEAMLVERTKGLKIGHGASEGTTIGPVTTERGVEKTMKHLEDAKRQGGKVLCGGKKPEGVSAGYFFEPTVVSMGDCRDVLASREETFGPMCALYSFETEEEAVKLCNDTSMGLASYFFTKNADRCWRLMDNLEAGMIGMNTGNMSAAESPFGGIKESGYGKESGKDVAVEEYLITKTGTMTVQDHY